MSSNSKGRKTPHDEEVVLIEGRPCGGPVMEGAWTADEIRKKLHFPSAQTKKDDMAALCHKLVAYISNSERVSSSSDIMGVVASNLPKASLNSFARTSTTTRDVARHQFPITSCRSPLTTAEFAAMIAPPRVALNLENCFGETEGIRYEQIAALASIVQRSKTLKTLNLARCRVDAKGAIEIAKALRSGTTALSTLELRLNKIGPEGAKAIAKALPFTTALKKIVLSDNFIKDEGAIAIGESLKTNNTLKELVLINCSIGPEGGKAIGVGLQAGITALRSLNLSFNQLGAEGAKAIAGAIASGTSAALKKIDLQFNALRNEDKQLVRDTVAGKEGFELQL